MPIKIAIKIAVFAAVVCIAVAVVMATKGLGGRAVGAAVDRDAGVIAKLAGYRQWKLVNPTPVKMDPAVSALCARPLLPREQNPHFDKFISVYVNQIGKAAMWTREKPKFPAGSIVVKEKLASVESTSPELLTVMIKHEKGYNNSTGDWEYLVTDGAAAKVVKEYDTGNCNTCHTAYAANDYVIRNYFRP
jgi:hypothetical protein